MDDQSSQETFSDADEVMSQTTVYEIESQSIEDYQMELITQGTQAQADRDAALRLQLLECIASTRDHNETLQITDNLQMNEVLSASQSLHPNLSSNPASHVNELISSTPSSDPVSSQQSSEDSGLQLDGEIDTSNPSSYQSSYSHIQALIDNPELLRTHPKRDEIEQILSCQDKAKLLKFMAELIEQRLETTLQRIRRKIVYIV